MNKFFRILHDNHASIFRTFLFIILIIVLAYLFPKDIRFKYTFQKAKPWKYETLIAPFDFPVYKSEEDIKKEKENIIKNFKPYYVLNNNIKNEVKNTVDKLLINKFKEEEEGKRNIFSKFFKKNYSKDSIIIKYKNYLHLLIDSIYNTGIIEYNDSLAKYESIVVLNNNIAEENNIKNFYTLKDAYNKAELILNNFKLKNFNKNLLLDIIHNSLKSNIIYDKNLNKKILKEEIDKISLTYGMIQKGERIISKGDIIDNNKYQILFSLKKKFKENIGDSSNHNFIIAGQILLITIIISLLYIFLFFFRNDVFNNSTQVIFILLLILSFSFMAKTVLKSDIVSIYLLPLAILPIIIRTFFDTRMALFILLISVLLISFIVPNSFEFIFLNMIAGTVSIFSIVNLRSRSQLLFTVLLIFISYSFSYVGLNLIQEGNFKQLHYQNFMWFAGNSLLTLLTYPVLYVFEKIFHFLSDVTLIELSNTNNKLLRELASKAPGTFQHSLQVANLAEEAIFEIGGNPLLVRTGALYHDIGKIYAPQYFIENQNPGYNPHDEISFEESAKKIIDHVPKGIEMARKHNLPEQIIDFIRTHHGTSITMYFYLMHKKENPDTDINQFRYPGPLPYSKESAVLMMADAVEAASRAMKQYTNKKIDELVENIINKQIEEKQFLNANITFKDITTVKKIFKKKLSSIYHARIQYPDEQT